MARPHTTKGARGVMCRYSELLTGNQAELAVSRDPEIRQRRHDAVETDLKTALHSLIGCRPQEALAVLHAHDIDATATDSDSTTR
jgi:hypothetical protein